MTEDGIEVGPSERNEGGGGAGRVSLELQVIGRQEALEQVAVGCGDRADPLHAQLVDQAILEGAVDALAPSPRLGGVSMDVLDAEKMSAAWIQVSRPASARTRTSCTFMARSFAAGV
jgi:hypothetical protein